MPSKYMIKLVRISRQSQHERTTECMESSARLAGVELFRHVWYPICYRICRVTSDAHNDDLTVKGLVLHSPLGDQSTVPTKQNCGTGKLHNSPIVLIQLPYYIAISIIHGTPCAASLWGAILVQMDAPSSMVDPSDY
jgi:hypothetical protein